MPTINDFRVLQPLGSGAFATVFKVQRKSDDKFYALKRVGISKMSKKEVADTLNEIRLLASLRHPNIVGFLEAFLDNGDTDLVTVLEYCGNGDLTGQIEKAKKARKCIEERIVWTYVLQAADALATLHEQGIMHRDVKAANVFLSEEGDIKLGDMNVSKTMKGGLLKTQIGTPYYMAPEIWSNLPYDSTGDMWALGCLAYELCALQPPFLANSFPALKKAVLAGKFRPLPSMYSYDMSVIVGRLLRVNPKERPTAAQFLALPEVLKRRGQQVDVPSPANPALMKTIQVPRKLSLIGGNLPKACYPDARPDSPHAWPAAGNEDSPPLVGAAAAAAPSRRRSQQAGRKRHAGLESVEENPPRQRRGSAARQERRRSSAAAAEVVARRGSADRGRGVTPAYREEGKTPAKTPPTTGGGDKENKAGYYGVKQSRQKEVGSPPQQPKLVPIHANGADKADAKRNYWWD